MPKNISRHSFLLYAVLFFLPIGVCGQDTILISSDYSNRKINAFAQTYVVEDSYQSVDELWDQIHFGTLEEFHDKENQGFNSGDFLIRFFIKNTQAQNVKIYLELDNRPGMDEVYLYENGSGLISQSGDMIGGFGQRSIQNVRTVMSANLDPEGAHEYLMVIKQIGSPASYPLLLWNETDFYKDDKRLNFARGIYFGIFAFIGLVFISIGWWSKNKLFVAYGFYVLAIFLGMLNHTGYVFQNIHPNIDQCTTYTRMITEIIYLIALANFIKHFFDVSIYAVRYVRRIFLLALIGLVIVVFTCALFPGVYANQGFEVNDVIYVCTISATCSALFIVAKAKKKNKERANLFIISFLGIVIGVAITILTENGIINDLDLVLSPLMIGTFIEILVLTYYMIYLITNMSREKVTLVTKIAEAQKNLAGTVAVAQEKERSHLARELHDSIGNNLAMLQRSAEKEEHPNLQIISDTLTQIRAISHSLGIPLMKKKDLQVTLTALSNEYSSKEVEYNVIFHDWPNIDNEDIRIHIYRIAQELFQNAYKHSQASNVFLQLLKSESGELQILYEDNGVGLQDLEESKGLGLDNIKYRVDSMNGQMKIESNKRGLSIGITLGGDLL